MNICAKRIRIEFNNSSEDFWEATSGSGISFDEAMRMIVKAWEEHDASSEPLIKDEKIRKAVRLCAYIWGADKILVIKSGSRIEFSDGSPSMRYVSFMRAEWQDEIEDRTYYAIEELCGTPPEPIEPTFIDLDERIKEKEIQLNEETFKRNS